MKKKFIVSIEVNDDMEIDKKLIEEAFKDLASELKVNECKITVYELKA